MKYRTHPSLKRITGKINHLSNFVSEERDLGARITLQAPKTSPWNILKLDVGLFAGNGIKSEIDNHKDFIGQLSINNSIKRYNKMGCRSFLL